MSRLKKLLAAALLLAVVAVLVNVFDSSHSARRLFRRKTKFPAVYARHFGKAKPIDPVGSQTAKVKITAFVQSANDCHWPTISFITRIAEAAPERVRAEFVDTGSEAGFNKAQEAHLDCDAGLLLNGKKQVEVEQDGTKRLIVVHGPIGMEAPPQDVKTAVEYELTKQYGAKLTGDELTKLAAVWKDIQSLMQGAHGPGDGSGKGKSGQPGPKGSPGTVKQPAADRGSAKAAAARPTGGKR